MCFGVKGKLTISSDASTANQYINLVSTQSGSARSYSLGINSGAFRLFDLTANQTRMTIDSSGNVLVGGSSAFGADTITLGTGGFAGIRNTSGSCLELRRDSTDGSILDFQKAGTNVGSIASISNDLVIYSSTASHAGLSFGNTRIEPTNNQGVIYNGGIDLGNTDSRFKDIYLAGGVVFGPASASNVSSQTLSSYEQGSWSPAITSYQGTHPTATGTFSGSYTKVGRLVTVVFNLDNVTVSGTTSNILAIAGLPFALAANGDGNGSAGANLVNFSRPDNTPFRNLGNTGIGILSSQNGGAWAWESVNIFLNGSYIRGSMTYYTS